MCWEWNKALGKIFNSYGFIVSWGTCQIMKDAPSLCHALTLMSSTIHATAENTTSTLVLFVLKMRQTKQCPWSKFPISLICQLGYLSLWHRAPCLPEVSSATIRKTVNKWFNYLSGWRLLSISQLQRCPQTASQAEWLSNSHFNGHFHLMSSWCLWKTLIKSANYTLMQWEL